MRHEAPEKTHCLSAIFYVFKKALKIDFPYGYIGDMPRRLIALSSWRMLKIDRESAQCGDLLFVKGKKMEAPITHAAMILGKEAIFHCCYRLKTAAIESDSVFFDYYEQVLNCKQMIRYVDIRNTSLKEGPKGDFILDD